MDVNDLGKLELGLKSENNREQQVETKTRGRSKRIKNIKNDSKVMLHRN